MADRLELELVTPQRRVLSETVDEVRLPGVLGEMGVLPGHTPLLTELGTGALAFTLTVAWVAWVFEWNSAWGVSNGPELTLWTMVLTGSLFARWLNDPAAAPDDDPDLFSPS